MGDDTKTDIEREKDEAREEVERLEEDPPGKLEDWPGGKAKYETFGGPEGEYKGEPIPGGPTDPDAAHEPSEPAEQT